ncbi:MAG: AAA family ATPase [Gemmatimonadetes bacterium]|nr:AAA family ATPase [Gemmatimonadota bacterium]
MPLDLDPRYTFDGFIVGSANRLAAAAGRRVAETPGTAYNPLFIYSASGLGKTHLLSAIGAHIRRLHPQLQVMYDTLEHLMDEVLNAIEGGSRDAFRQQLRDVAVLLLDDVQFLAGRRAAQEQLLRAWDGLLARGGQVVLASDRPPAEIDGLDERLLSRFSGGLIADLGTPDYETRVAIVTRKAEDRGLALGAGVAQALARVPVANVRELQGALNRVVAVQELERRAVGAQEVAALLGLGERPAVSRDEFEAFLSEIAGVLEEAPAEAAPERLLGEAIERWQSMGFRTTRLEGALGVELDHAAAEALLAGFEQDVTRLQEIAAAVQELDAHAPELARADLLHHPDRVAEAENLLGQVRERMAPLPEPPAGPTFAELALSPDLLPVRAARAVALEPGERYNPFYVHGPAGAGKTALLVALAGAIAQERPDLPLAVGSGESFAAELIDALARNQVDSWRARYRRARVLVIDDVDALVDTERAQQELFHLYDDVRRSGGQLVFSAACPPRELLGLEPRLRSRLESGLVVELVPLGEGEPVAASPAPAALSDAQRERLLGADTVLWRWPYLQDTLLPNLD